MNKTEHDEGHTYFINDEPIAMHASISLPNHLTSDQLDIITAKGLAAMVRASYELLGNKMRFKPQPEADSTEDVENDIKT